MRRLLLLVFVAAAALAASAACIRPGQVTLQTARLLPSLFGAELHPLLGIGYEPIAKGISDVGPAYPGAMMQVYRPARGRHPGLIVSLGIDPAPPDDPRVVSLLSGLARDGIIAALVESPDLREGRLTADAPDLLVAAFERLTADPSVVPDRVGFLGLSVGGALVLLAAADPQISGRVRVVEAVGAYANLVELARSVVTGRVQRGGVWEPWQPAPLATEAVHTNLVALLPAPDAYRVLNSQDPQAFDAAMLAIPASQRAKLEALSPEPRLRLVRAPVYLMVDKSDTFVPPEQSASIAGGLRRSGTRVYLSSFDILEHVEPGAAHTPLLHVVDGMRLFFHLRAVLSRL